MFDNWQFYVNEVEDNYNNNDICIADTNNYFDPPQVNSFQEFSNMKINKPSITMENSIKDDRQYKTFNDYSNTHQYFPGEIENRTIQIDCLNPKTSRADMEQYCRQFGDVGDIDMNNISKGQATVFFFDIRAAIQMRSKINGHVMNRHALKGKFGPFSKVEYSKHPPNEGTIVIFNLPTDITTEQLISYFGIFGDIKDIRSSPNKQTQKFIEYYNINDAKRAKEEANGKFFGNSRLIVEFSLPGGFRKVQKPTPSKSYHYSRFSRNRSIQKVF